MSDPHCNFYIGQKITLRNPVIAHPQWAEFARQHGVRWPEFGVVYTVRELFMDTGLQRVGVRLAEIINPVMQFADGIKELGYWHCDFRPVTDISSLEALLKEANSGTGKDSDHSRRRRKVETV